MSQENLNQQQQQQQQQSQHHQQTVVHHIQGVVNANVAAGSPVHHVHQIIPKQNEPLHAQQQPQQQDRVPSPSDTASSNKNGIKILASPPQSVNIVANNNNNNNNLMSSSMIGVRGGREGTGDSNDQEEDTDEDETNEVVEESSDGRWSKRNESVSRGDVPGIDHAYLAMDTEYGCEVVWNEIKLSNGKRFKNENLHNDEKEIDRVFKNLINLNHPNIVKFHDYWIDKRENNPRIIFITEYLSSGSLKQFLRKAKRTNQSIKRSTWKRWCIQLLTALDYLHNSTPAVLHSDLSCDTIFIQHNGLIKIGSIAPDIVNTNVRTCDMSRMARHLHFIAPEMCETTSTSDDTSITSTAADIYSFGMVALEMFNLEFGGNGDTHPITPELIKQSIEALDSNQQDFINICLQLDAAKRPTAKQLLFHPLLFEVPSLRLLATHQIVKNQNESKESNTERIFNDSAFVRPAEFVIARINSTNGTFDQQHDFKFSQLASFDANKFLEDVKTGNYPLTAYGLDYQLKKNTTSTINNNANYTNTENMITRSSQSNQETQQLDMSSSARSTAISSSVTSKSSSSSASPSQTLIMSESNTMMGHHQHNVDEVSQDLELVSAQMQNSIELNNNNFIPTHSRTQSPTANNIINNNTILNSNGAIILNNNNNTTSGITTSTTNNNNVVYGESEYVLAQQQQQHHIEYAASMAKLETRHAQQIDINVFLDDKKIYRLTLNITFEDRSARVIQSPLNKSDTVNNLADELVSCGLVNELDRENLCIRLDQALKKIDLFESTTTTTTESFFTHQNTIL